MPDITMCTNESCTLRDKCRRATATPSSYQSYAEFEPTKENGEETCEYFWDNKGYN